MEMGGVVRSPLVLGQRRYLKRREMHPGLEGHRESRRPDVTPFIR